MANPKFLVTAAMAVTGTAGSPMGYCVPVRTHASAFPLYTSHQPCVSAKKMALKSPFSRRMARSVQYERSLLLVAERSFGLRHWPKDMCPTVNMSKALRNMRRFGFGSVIFPVFAISLLVYSDPLAFEGEPSCRYLQHSSN